MPPDTLLPLAGLVLVFAALYASVGHAGASGYLAAMALLGVEPALMKPTALALNLIVAAIGTVSFARAGCFVGRLFWPLVLTSVPAAFVGGRIRLEDDTYKTVVGLVLVWASLRLVMVTRAAETPRPPHAGWLLAVGAGLGLLSGLSGVGGGIFLSPLLLLAGWADPRQTAGVSVAFILVNSAAGLAGFVTAGGELPLVAPLLALAAGAGGLAGAWFGSRRLAPLALRRLLALVVVLAAAKMLLG
jgi:uncharacterized membrane protein YfcA